MNPVEANRPAVRLRGLSKKFGGRFALRDLDLTVNSGDGLALFGPNGAGKTTLLRILSLELRPTTGTLSIDGCDPRSESRNIRARIGCISHRSLLYEQLTARENLEFFSRLHGVTDARKRADTLLREFALDTRAEDPVAQLSRGMRQRLSIARALVHEPSLVLLDEPFTGLDRRAANVLESLLRRLEERGCTRILITHDIGCGLRLSNCYAVMARARILHEGASHTAASADIEALLESGGAIA